MSALSHQVIAHQQNGAMQVFPSCGKLLSKKDAQRLTDELLNRDAASDPQMTILKAVVVSTVLVAT